MKINEIFTPGKFPTWTFIDDHLVEKAQQLNDILDDGSMLISISGPSKSGKTVFVENVLGKERLIQVTGAGVTKPEDLWLRVFGIIGSPIPGAITNTTSKAGTLSGKTSGSADVFIAKGSAEVSASGTYTATTSQAELTPVDFLSQLISELKETDFVIFIDDFHYISSDIQNQLARQIKEAIRHGVKFICASVPYHSDDVIRSNPDLRGRIFSIDFEYWGEDVLKKIAFKGFKKANVNYRQPFVDRLVAESAGSPQLMQYLCLNTCYELNVRTIPDESVDLSNSDVLFEKACKRTVLSTDYGSIVDLMIEGPKTRGSDRKLYQSIFDWQGDVYKLLLKAISLNPPQLNFRYQPLVDRINSICVGDSPSGSSITSACFHSTSIANIAATDNIVEWDGEHDVFDIRDPYLLFFLRWSESI